MAVSGTRRPGLRVRREAVSTVQVTGALPRSLLLSVGGGALLARGHQRRHSGDPVGRAVLEEGLVGGAGLT